MTQNSKKVAKILIFALLLTGCATKAVEKTAPCKRPSIMSSFADDRRDCGAMHPVNNSQDAIFNEILKGS